MVRVIDSVVNDKNEIAHSIEGSVANQFEQLTQEEIDLIGLSEIYDNAKLETIKETYNSRFARSRNIFRISKLSNFSERTKAKGKKMAFRSGTAFVLNYSADALSIVPVTVPGAIVASTVAGALGTGYDSFINKQTSHKLFGYSQTQEFLTAKSTLEPDALKGRKREYRDLIERLDGADYAGRADVEADLAEVKKLIRAVEDGMIYNARTSIEVKVTSDKAAANKGWIEVDGLNDGLAYLYEQKRILTGKLVEFEADSETKRDILLGLMPSDIAKQKDKVIEDVVAERIQTLKSRIKSRQNRMWVGETVASTALSVTGGLIVGKWAERSLGWGEEIAKATKSSLNQYFEYNKDIFVENPIKFKGTLSTVADTHIADQIDKVLSEELDKLSKEELSLREFAEFKGITDGSQFRPIYESEFLNNADSEQIQSLISISGDADLDTAEGAIDFVTASGMDRYAVDVEANLPILTIFEDKEIVTGDEMVSLMKRNPRVFGDLDQRYIGDVKYFDAVSRMPKEDLDKYMQSFGDLEQGNYTAEAAVKKLEFLASQADVSYEERLVRVPVVENYQVVSGDSVYQILEKNNIALDSPESVKFVSDNRESLLITASQFGNEDDLNQMLAKIDSGEMDSISDDLALSGRALHWISTGDQFSIQTGFEERVERVAVGEKPAWLTPIEAPKISEVPVNGPETENIVTAEKIIDLRNSHIPEKLEISSIGLSTDVNEVASLSNVDYPYLNRDFVGHMAETGAMGYDDWPNKNMIIGGHVSYQGNPAVFYNLHKVQGGEVIKITDVSGRETLYKIRSMEIVHESEIGQRVGLASNDEILTLITCQYNQNENKIVVVADKWDPTVAVTDEDKLAQIRSRLAAVKQVFDFSAESPKATKTTSNIVDLKKFRDQILSKVA